MDLFLIGLIYLAFFLVGEKVCGICKLQFKESAEAAVFCTALGLVVVALTTMILAFLGWMYPVTPWVLLALIYLSRARAVAHLARSFFGRLRNWPRMRIFTSLGWFGAFNLMILGTLIVLAFSLALVPATKTDALVYHLAVPKAFLENHGIVNLPNNIYSFFPLLFDMIYLFCLALGNDTLAQLAGLGMTFLLLGALTLYYRQNFSSRYAPLVPVLYFSTPTFFLISFSAYVDLQVAAFSFLAFYAWHLWRTRESRGWFWLMAIFAGSAAATKLTAYIIVPLVILGIVLQGVKKGRPADILKNILLLAVIVAAFLFPWWARNYYFTGNPFAPLFMQFFETGDGINWDISRSLAQLSYYSAFGMGRDFTDVLLLPFHLTFFSEYNSLKFDGKIGILFLLLLPALFWLKKRSLPLLVCFLTLLLFWFVHFQYIRLLGSAFAFLTLLTVAGLEAMTRPGEGAESPPPTTRWRSLIPVGVALGIVFNLGLVGIEWNRLKPLPYLLGQESRDQYLTRHLPSYPLYQKVNRSLGPDEKVLFVYMRNFGYLCDRNFISDTFFEAHTLQTVLEKEASVEGIGSRLKSMGVTHLLFDFKYVFGELSAFTGDQRAALKNFLNAKAQLVEGKNGYYLYRFVVN